MGRAWFLIAPALSNISPPPGNARKEDTLAHIPEPEDNRHLDKASKRLAAGLSIGAVAAALFAAVQFIRDKRQGRHSIFRRPLK